jgi:hypothetical protein
LVCHDGLQSISVRKVKAPFGMPDQCHSSHACRYDIRRPLCLCVLTMRVGAHCLVHKVQKEAACFPRLPMPGPSQNWPTVAIRRFTTSYMGISHRLMLRYAIGQ